MTKKSQEMQQELPLEESIGYQLKRAREALSISAEDVADRLCLPYSTINDIEHDHYFGKKNTVYMRGYIRAYARMVKLSPITVQKAFISAELISPSKIIESSSGCEIKEPAIKSKSVKLVTYTVIGCFILFAFIFSYSH